MHFVEESKVWIAGVDVDQRMVSADYRIGGELKKRMVDEPTAGQVGCRGHV